MKLFKKLNSEERMFLYNILSAVYHETQVDKRQWSNKSIDRYKDIELVNANLKVLNDKEEMLQRISDKLL